MRRPPAGTADLLIVNGRIFRGLRPGREPPLGSVDGPRPRGAPTAIAVVGERIAWLGGTAEALRSWRGPGTELLDARGGLVSAGFDDAHIHLLEGARQLGDIDLAGATTPEEIGAAIRAGAAKRPGKVWVVGRGWAYSSFPAGLPSRQLLDRLVPDRPALMGAYDGHTTWVNSRALAVAGIGVGTANPANGVIVRDPATDEPTGVLLEGAGHLVEERLPVPTVEEDVAVLRAAISLAHRNGITAVQEAWTLPSDLPVWQRLPQEGGARIRARLALPMRPDGDLRSWRRQLAEYAAMVRPMRDGRWVSAGILKGFVDGVIESETAAMLAPYEGSASLGTANWAPEQLTEFVGAADARGWQVELHAIGDRGVRMALDAFERARNVARRRHRVEHIETIDRADIPRFGRLGVIASIQPLHGEPATNQITAWAPRIGADRISRAWAANSIGLAGGTLAFGSDWPVVSFNPFLGLHVAVNRQTADGHPPGGWIAAEAVSLPRALSAYTLGSAVASCSEKWRGTIRVGLEADLVVLDRDLLAEDHGAIAATEVRATIVGGTLVHRTLA